MKSLLLLLFLAGCLSGCSHHESQRAILHIDPAMSASLREKPIHIEPGARLESFVGKRVELVGTVSDSGVPQIQGVDLWGFERFRGKRLLVSGGLQRTVISSSGEDSSRAQDSGTDGFVAPAYRSTGTFYRLQYLAYDLLDVGPNHCSERWRTVAVAIGAPHGRRR